MAIADQDSAELSQLNHTLLDKKQFERAGFQKKKSKRELDQEKCSCLTTLRSHISVSNHFFSSASTSVWKNFMNVVARKINIPQEFININAKEKYLATCQSRKSVRTNHVCDLCQTSRKTFTYRYIDSCSFSSDKTNDLTLSTEIRHCSRQFRKNICISSTRPVESMMEEKTAEETGTTNELSLNIYIRSGSEDLSPTCENDRITINESHPTQKNMLSKTSAGYPTVARFDSSPSKPKHNDRISNFLPSSSFLLLSLLLLTTMSTALVDGRRHSSRRGSGSRHPRQSGFQRRMPFSSPPKCEDITVPLCKDIGYNKTDMSLSLMNKFTQTDARKELDLFSPLLQMNCSAEMKLLLCSVYTPICMEGYGKYIPPCRFICRRARRGCLPVLLKYQHKWPESLDCDQFPTHTTERSMCMHFNLTKPSRDNEPPATRRSKSAKRTNSSTTPATTTTKLTISNISTTSSTRAKATAKNISNISYSIKFASNGDRVCNPICRPPMVTITAGSDPLYNKVSTGGVENCAVSCKSPYFTDEERSLAERIIKWLSAICFVVTLITVATFLVDMDRFEYPQRPIIFMSICYMFVSIGFLIRIVAGHEAVGCAYNANHILYHSSGPALCATVFILVYFFSMASAIWWVILSLSWFLAGGLKWGNEAIAKYFHVYHIVAWIFPGVLTILVIVLSCVDGDSLTGICFVGNQDVQNLRGFVLFPFVICFACGSLFLLAGFVSLIRIKSRFRKDGKKADKFERLVWRIGFCNVIYMLSAAFLVTCYFYEQQNRSEWETSHNCASDSKNIVSYQPSFYILIARQVMTLIIGITNGVWIFSSKTLDSWKGFYRRCVCCLHSSSCPPTYGKKIEKSNVNQSANEDVRSERKSCSSQSRQESSLGARCSEINHEDSLSRSNKSSNYNESHSLKAKSENSRSSRKFAESRRTGGMMSRQSSCPYCNTNNHSISSNMIYQNGQKQKRKKMRSRSRTSSERATSSLSSRRNRTDAEVQDESRNRLCCSNTTSTDGSERPPTECRNPSPPAPCKTSADQYSFSDSSRQIVSSVGPNLDQNREEDYVQSSLLQDEICINCPGIREKYVINCDNLPPPSLHPYSGHSSASSASPHCFVTEQSITSLDTTDYVVDINRSLLCPSSDVDYYSDEMHPHFHHYHHHHFHGQMLS